MISYPKSYALQYFIMGISALMLATLAIILPPKKCLIIVAGLVVVFFIFRNPRIGLALTLVAIINFGAKGKFTVGAEGLFLSVAKILGALTAVAWLFQLLTQRKKIVFTRVMAYGLAFVTISLLSVTIAINKKWGLIDTSKLVVNFTLFFLIANLIENTKQLKNIMLVLILTGLVTSVAAIVQVKFPDFQMSGVQSVIKFGHEDGGIRDPQQLKSGSFVRPTGTLGHPNWLSMFMITLLPLTVYGAKRSDHKPVRYFCFITLGCQLATMILTHDRLAFLGFLFLFSLALWYRLIPLTPLLVFLVSVAIFVMPFVVPATYVERLFSVENYQKSDSIKERWEVLTAALEIFINNPITGVGAGNYGFVYMRDYRESQVHIHVDYIRQQGSTYTDHSVGAHNMYAEVAAETGLFGLITLLTFIFSGIKMMYRLHRENILPEWKQLPLAIMLSIIGFAFAGIFLHGQLQKAIWIVTGFAVALSQMAKRQRALNAKTT